MKKFALVLGGGATKGYAHIGVIKVLEENGITPDLIIGTSMGAIIGGAYCAGTNSEQLTNISKKLNRKSVFDFDIFHALFQGSILKGKRLKKLLKNVLGDISHDQLNIPFVAVATNLLDGKQVLLDTGKLVDNIMASSAIPSIYPPIEQEGQLLCDGGLVNNVPDDVVKKYGKDYIILSVDVIGEYKKQVELSKIRTLSRVVNAMTLMQTEITKHKGSNSHIRIKISQPDVPQMDFSALSAEKSIKYGENAMKRHISKLKNLLQDE